MSRTTRMFELLQALRRHRRPVSGAHLAAELGVSLRTLYRDIAALQAIGADIDGEPGLGYVMRPGFTLPPLMFSDDEIEALALGLRWVTRRADDDSLGPAAAEALAKVAAVLPGDLRHKLEQSALLVGPGVRRPQAVELAVLRAAIREQRRLQIGYRDERGRRSSRTIWPIAVGFFESTRVLIAWCELRGAFRHFRTDRIESALAGERYPRRRPQLLREWRSMLTESDSSPPYSGPSQERSKDKDTAMNAEIVLYTHPWSRGAIAHWMLEETGAPYRVEIVEYGAAMKSPAYLAINAMGKVPALRHGDVVVTETAAICAYLADAFPEAGLAPPPADRGDYYRWLFFGAGPLESALSMQSCGFEPTAEQQVRVGYGSLQAVVDTLAQALRGRRYIAGDRFSAADVYLGAQIGWAMKFDSLEKRPEFVSYWDGLKDRPAHQRVIRFIDDATAEKTWATP